MVKQTCSSIAIAALLAWPLAAQQPPAASTAAEAAQPTRFVGTWVGTQAWAIADPPPGARSDQPVTLTIEVVQGQIVGTMTPFLGGEDGATFVEAVIVGDELRVKAVVGRPRQPTPGATSAPAPASDDPDAPAPVAGPGRRVAPPSWKDPIAIAFAFKNDGVTLTGTADVHMGDVPWMKFSYDLSKKRSRY